MEQARWVMVLALAGAETHVEVVCAEGMVAGGYSMGRRRFISPKNELSALEKEEKMLLEDLEIIKAEKQALKAQK